MNTLTRKLEFAAVILVALACLALIASPKPKQHEATVFIESADTVDGPWEVIAEYPPIQLRSTSGVTLILHAYLIDTNG